VIDAATQALLGDIIRREGRSLLQYVSEAFPWTQPEEQAALEQFQQLVQEEQQAVAGLIGFMQRRRLTPPALGTYPMSFTNINFVSLDHLLPVLANHQRQAIQALERDLTRVSDPEAQQQVQTLLAMKRRHLQALEEIARNNPQPALT
jgi:rubrerythrin